MKKTLLIYTLLVSISAVVSATPGDTASPAKNPSLDSKPEKKPPAKAMPRGQLLYQNHCMVCHESNVHIRERKKVGSLADITMWVSKWSDYRKLDWSTDEIRAVRDYLNQTYYHFTE
jgi:cytochrome c5